MPHILLENHNDIDIISCENFTFIATGKNDQKIGVISQNNEFLLTKVTKKEESLIKLDSCTRLTPVSMMKDALNDYAKLSNAQILFANTDSNNNKVLPKKEYLKDINYFADEFETTKEIWVEVGFGSGTHMLHQAVNNPDKLIIGLEIHYPSIEQVLKQIKIQNLTNVLIINYDARLFLEFLKSNTVGRIFVHFPVPWDKKPHRRVMSIAFIEESMRVLRIDGTLELRTDSPNYFEYSSSLLPHFDTCPNKILKNEESSIISKYEARWKRQEKDIWDIIITSTVNSKPIVLNDTFVFDGNFSTDDIEKKLSNRTIKDIEFIIHFEYIYTFTAKDNTDGLLIKVTMGSFNRPVSKYIIMENKKLRYYQGDPIKTKINLEAHRKILEMLS
jgi:tRNA (guanine-N7-)-methyltransferase